MIQLLNYIKMINLINNNVQVLEIFKKNKQKNFKNIYIKWKILNKFKLMGK